MEKDRDHIYITVVQIQGGEISQRTEEIARGNFRFSGGLLTHFEECHGKDSVFIITSEYYEPQSLSWRTRVVWYSFQFFEDRVEAQTNNERCFYIRALQEWFVHPEAPFEKYLTKTVRVIGLPMDDFGAKFLVEDDGQKRLVSRYELSK